MAVVISYLQEKTDWVVSKTLHVITFTFFLRLLRFQNPKKRDFLRFFALLHTFSRTIWPRYLDRLLYELQHSWQWRINCNLIKEV